MKVVVIDDDPFVLSLMKAMLQRKGHTVLAYSNPLECPVYHASSYPCAVASPCPDIIITDYDMPQVNGMEFLMYAYERRCRCKNVAIITGKGVDEANMIRMAKLGVRYFLKPIDFDELYDWMSRVQIHDSSDCCGDGSCGRNSEICRPEA